MKRFAIVYQCGIANVFDVTHASPDMPEMAPFTDESKRWHKSRRRLLQASFTECEYFMRGAVAAGATSLIFHCDRAGDISAQDWEPGIGPIFAESKSYA